MELLHNLDLVLVIVLFVSGIAAFILSTISGGGGALVLVPVLNWTIGVTNTAPVLNLGTMIGRPARLIIFWKHINWRVFFYYVPTAIAGAYLAAWLFSNVHAEWLQILVGLFLISTVFQYRFGKKERSFKVETWYFIPLGFIVSIFGTIIGALGPVLNPFYLNLGLDKEALIATKTANSFFMGLAQIGSYTFFGLIHGEFWFYGIALGMGAVIGNLISKRFLSKMSSKAFRRWVLAIMVIAGCLMIYRQLNAIF